MACRSHLAGGGPPAWLAQEIARGPDRVVAAVVVVAVVRRGAGGALGTADVVQGWAHRGGGRSRARCGGAAAGGGTGTPAVTQTDQPQSPQWAQWFATLMACDDGLARSVGRRVWPGRGGHGSATWGTHGRPPPSPCARSPRLPAHQPCCPSTSVWHIDIDVCLVFCLFVCLVLLQAVVWFVCLTWSAWCADTTQLLAKEQSAAEAAHANKLLALKEVRRRIPPSLVGSLRRACVRASDRVAFLTGLGLRRGAPAAGAPAD
jgi:hypothetical protein